MAALAGEVAIANIFGNYSIPNCPATDTIRVSLGGGSCYREVDVRPGYSTWIPCFGEGYCSITFTLCYNQSLQKNIIQMATAWSTGTCDPGPSETGCIVVCPGSDAERMFSNR